VSTKKAPPEEGAKLGNNVSRLTSKTPEHYTPEWLVEKSRLVLGGIDLDPASCAQGPPRFVEGTHKLVCRVDLGTRNFIGRPDFRGVHLIIKVLIEAGLGSLSHVSQPSSQSVKRVRFTGDSPTMDNFVAFFPPEGNEYDESIDAFKDVFSEVGAVSIPSFGPA
jgi:hypothetical protein